MHLTSAARTSPYVVGLAMCLALAGCLGDPAPHPTEAPLEIVLDSCSLNRGSVQVGTHDFAAVGEGVALVKDPSGNDQFEVDASGHPPEAHPLTEGTWTIECTTPGKPVATVQLRVDPAE